MNPNRIVSIYSSTQDENPTYRGCGFYRNITPAEYLKNKYNITCSWTPAVNWVKDLTVSDEENLLSYTDYLWNTWDTIIVHHLDKPHAIAYLYGMRELYYKKYGKRKRIIVDVDDNYDNVQDINRQLFFHNEDEYATKKHFINIALKYADGITTSTENLQEYYKGINNNIYYCPNMAWEEYWQPFDMRAVDDTVNIVYWGSSTHINDLKSVMEVLSDILNENPEVRLFLMGQTYFPTLNEHPQVIILPPDRSFKTFVDTVKENRFDIGIAPLYSGDPFNKYKSNIKYLEYGYFRIPGVFSGDKTHAYYKVVKPGKTGFLANNYKDWKHYLLKLVKNSDLRHKMGEAAYLDQKNYGFSSLGHYWDTAYKHLLETSSEEARLATLGIIKGRG